MHVAIMNSNIQKISNNFIIFFSEKQKASIEIELLKIVNHSTRPETTWYRSIIISQDK